MTKEQFENLKPGDRFRYCGGVTWTVDARTSGQSFFWARSLHAARYFYAHQAPNMSLESPNE